jgi:hypothetical protein
MTTLRSTRNTQHGLVPELGPSLGRLTAMPGAPVGAPPAPRAELADLRLALVGRLFELAAAARGAVDGDGAAEILAPARLRLEWERAAAQVATRTLERIESTLTLAARGASLPARHIRRAAPTTAEIALIKARLHGAGVPFVDGLTALDTAEAGSDEWRTALLASARRLEECWLALEQRALAEEEAWQGEAARLSAWRPSPWPRRIVAASILIICVYAGLVLGGFLPVPPGAAAITRWWWSHGP